MVPNEKNKQKISNKKIKKIGDNVKMANIHHGAAYFCGIFLFVFFSILVLNKHGRIRDISSSLRSSLLPAFSYPPFHDIFAVVVVVITRYHKLTLFLSFIADFFFF